MPIDLNLNDDMARCHLPASIDNALSRQVVPPRPEPVDKKAGKKKAPPKRKNDGEDGAGKKAKPDDDA
eukprot:SAG31_NODE_353_length_17229_cov_8.702160_15_plen_68_part_00